MLNPRGLWRWHPSLRCPAQLGRSMRTWPTYRAARRKCGPYAAAMPASARAKALYVEGMMENYQGDHRSAEPLLEESIGLFRELDGAAYDVAKDFL